MAAKFVPQFAMIEDDVRAIIGASDRFDFDNGTRVGCAIRYRTVKGELRHQRVSITAMSQEVDNKSGRGYTVDKAKTDQIRFAVIHDFLKPDETIPEGTIKSCLASHVEAVGADAE